MQTSWPQRHVLFNIEMNKLPYSQQQTVSERWGSAANQFRLQQLLPRTMNLVWLPKTFLTFSSPEPLTEFHFSPPSKFDLSSAYRTRNKPKTEFYKLKHIWCLSSSSVTSPLTSALIQHKTWIRFYNVLATAGFSFILKFLPDTQKAHTSCNFWISRWNLFKNLLFISFFCVSNQSSCLILLLKEIC